MSKKLTKEEILNRFKETHGDKYDYSLLTEYNSMQDVIQIICPIHNDKPFKQMVKNHLGSKNKKGYGCRKCGRESATNLTKIPEEEAIRRFRAVYGDFYDYSNLNYRTFTDFVDIVCPKHGPFRQIAIDHLRFKCKACGDEDKGGWDRNRFKKACERNSGLGTFYILNCYNEEESFYKLGITSRVIKNRYGSKERMPYDYNIIQEIQAEPDCIWNIEKYLKSYIKKNKLFYTPKIHFPGCLSECYVLDNK